MHKKELVYRFHRAPRSYLSLASCSVMRSENALDNASSGYFQFRSTQLADAFIPRGKEKIVTKTVELIFKYPRPRQSVKGGKSFPLHITVVILPRRTPCPENVSGEHRKKLVSLIHSSPFPFRILTL